MRFHTAAILLIASANVGRAQDMPVSLDRYLRDHAG